MAFPDTAWSEMFPEGRYIFYEGDYPELFAEHIMRKHGFDVRLSPDWGVTYPGCDFTTYAFHCPVHALDAIYGSGKYPMGS